jgi:putative peptide zinc metalloprotease protein
MPVDRPTFSESWYRVADLRPRLRATVQMHRQHFRGLVWHVVQDPASNQFFRLNEEAYQFVALLDGRRTVADVWKICNEQLGDRAPTQGEAIQLLGQLYTSNLLQGDMPPDADGLLRRYRQRITREVQSYLSNILFIRLPILDPDRFLDRTVGFFGLVFTPWGFLVWLAMVITGLYFVAGRTGELLTGATNVLDPKGLPLMYAAVVLTKIIHEFGHSFACKKFGRESGSGGEVHVMGLMFLIFTPLPYMDASSSWAFRNKRHRAIVGAAGMYVEIAVAAIAAVIWSQTQTGSAIHTLTFNMVFIGSISTVLFNANPLLRYDGYYILSDLVEIPNLAQRGKEYVYYLVRKHVWNVRQARNPAHTPGESVWLFIYAVTSMVYRIFISVAILLFVSASLPFLGMILAAMAIVAWVLVPIGKFVHYLASNSELMRVRTRAMATSMMVPAVIVAALGFIPAPDRCTIEGVVEPVQMAVVYPAVEGFLVSYAPSGEVVTTNGAPLATLSDPRLVAEHKAWLAQKVSLEGRLDVLRARGDLATAQAVEEEIAAAKQKIKRMEDRLADLEVHAPFDGTWLAPQLDLQRGAYLDRDHAIGVVTGCEGLHVRAVAGQDVVGLLRDEGRPTVEMRVDGRPDATVTGTVKQFLPAGQERLPSPALGYGGGGTTAVSPDDTKGMKATEHMFEIQIAPDPPDPANPVRLLAGQRVVIRFEVLKKPYLAQWWRSILQLIQRRFKV